MSVCLIITGKRLNRSVPNFEHRSTSAQRWFLDYFFFDYLFFIFIGAVFGWDWVGRGGGRGGRGREVRVGEGRGGAEWGGMVKLSFNFSNNLGRAW